MRILAIRGENIASLVKFDVDFRTEPLRSAGIFAITGPTGSGKSSLLDAMCLALFQEAPRLEGVSSQEGKLDSRFGAIGQNDIRNLLRRGTGTGFAECEFLGRDGREYRAHWGFRAPKRTGASVQEELSLVRLEDGQVLVHGNRKNEFQAQVVELLGLTYQQFTRTVLLAQGRFAEFLRSKGGDRAELLEKLTGTEIYARISMAVFERAAVQKEECRRLQSDLDALHLLPDPEREALADGLRQAEEDAVRLQREFDDFRLLQSGLGKLSASIEERQTLETGISGLEAELSGKDELLAARGRDLEAAVAEDARLQPLLAQATELDNRLSMLEGRRQDRRRQEEQDRQAHGRSGDELEESRDQAAATTRRIEEIASELKRNERLDPVSGEWSRWRESLSMALRLGGKRDECSRDLAEVQEQFRTLDMSLASDREECSRLSAVLGDLTLAELGRRRESLAALRQDLSELSRLREQEVLESKTGKELAAAREERGGLERSLPALEASLATARAMWESVRLAVGKDLEELRAHLEEEKPCPVCGSTEHPWAKDASSLRRLATAQEQTVRQAQEARDQAHKRHTYLVARMEGLERELSEIARRKLSIPVSPALRERAQAQADLDAWLESERERLDREQEVADASTAPMERLDELRRSVSLDELRRTRLAQDLERIATEREALVAELESRSAQIDAAFGSPAWRGYLDEQKEAYLRRMDAIVAAHLKSQRELQELQEELRRTDARIEDLTRRRLETGAAWEQSRSLLADVEKELEALGQDRGKLLQGRPVGEVREQSQADVLAARAALESEQESGQEQARRLQQLQGQLEATRRRIRQDSQELRTIGTRLLPSCPDVLELAAGELDAIGSALGTNLDGARAGYAEIAATLENDDRNRQKGDDLQRELASARERYRHWGSLSDAIGSRDGKAFRTIAQQFTLDALLRESNRELRGITRRYSLRSLSDSMNFGVVDHEAFDELRPVQTLSGGESFLVSLALALGLSRLAGGSLSVESLFIDEGFGTLDPDTLRAVMNALSQLHAQGRKVGLITHVEEMKELIPVRLEVVPTGQGASRILMPT